MIRHKRDDEQRSAKYDALVAAEERALDNQKGIHSPKEPPVLRISDASETAAKAKQFFPFLTVLICLDPFFL